MCVLQPITMNFRFYNESYIYNTLYITLTHRSASSLSTSDRLHHIKHVQKLSSRRNNNIYYGLCTLKTYEGLLYVYAV